MILKKILKSKIILFFFFGKNQGVIKLGPYIRSGLSLLSVRKNGKSS